MNAAKQFQIDIATNPSVIIFTAEPIATNLPSAIPIASISDIQGIFFDYSTVEANESGDQFKETYPFPTMTQIIIETMDGESTRQKFELQSCTNQATWNGGTQADLQQALTDLIALL